MHGTEYQRMVSNFVVLSLDRIFIHNIASRQAYLTEKSYFQRHCIVVCYFLSFFLYKDFAFLTTIFASVPICPFIHMLYEYVLHECIFFLILKPKGRLEKRRKSREQNISSGMNSW